MTEENRKLSKEILDIYLKECHSEHKVQISEKYIGYIMLAMENYAMMRRTLLDKITLLIIITLSISCIVGILGITYAILTKGL